MVNFFYMNNKIKLKITEFIHILIGYFNNNKPSSGGKVPHVRHSYYLNCNGKTQIQVQKMNF